MTNNFENGSLNSNAPMPQTPIPAPPAGLSFPAQPPVLPAQPPSVPAQPPVFPAQPPAMPTQPPAIPNQVSAPQFVSQPQPMAYEQPQYAPAPFANDEPKKPKNRVLIIVLAIVLAVVLLAGIVFGAFMLFGNSHTEPKSALSASAPVPITVVDVTNVPKEMKMVPVNSDSFVLQTPGYDILRFADDKQSTLMGVPINDGEKPWLSEIPVAAPVLELDGKVLYGGKDANAQFQAIDTKTGRKSPDSVKVPQDKLPKPGAQKQAEGCVNAKDAGNAIASISAEKITVCSDGKAVWGVIDKKATWTLPDLGDLKSVNGFGSANQKWMLDGDMLVFATPKAVQAIDARDGKNLWSVEKPVRSWSVNGNSLYIEEDGVRQLTKYDLSKNPKPAKDNQTPIKPEDSKKTEAAELFKKLQGKTMSAGVSKLDITMVFGADGQVSGRFLSQCAYNCSVHQKYQGKFEYLGMKNPSVARLKMTGMKLLEAPKKDERPDGYMDNVLDEVPTIVDGDEYELYLPETKASDTILGVFEQHNMDVSPAGTKTQLSPNEYALVQKNISSKNKMFVFYTYAS